MVAQSRSYYSDPFKVYIGFVKGDIFSPNMVNVVVDTIFRHRLKIV